MPNATSISYEDVEAMSQQHFFLARVGDVSGVLSASTGSRAKGAPCEG